MLPYLHHHLSDSELNLGWVFDALLSTFDTPGDQDSPVAKAARKRALLDSSGEPAQLTVAHVRHVFNAMHIQMTQEELEEVLRMMDENADGKVTLEDFWHAMKGQTQTHTHTVD